VKQYRRLYHIFCSILLFTGYFAAAVECAPAPIMLPAQSNSSPQFWTDISFYKGAAGYTQLEVYYSMAARELTFSDSSGRNLADFTYSLKITNQEDQAVVEKNQRKQLIVNSAADIYDDKQGIIDQIICDLLPGNYHLDFVVRDQQGEKQSRISGDLQVPAFTDSLAVSTPLLASLISSDLSRQLFIKGNKEVIPNTSRKYLVNKSLLYIYIEVYNLIFHPGESGQSFKVSYCITNNAGDSLIIVPEQSVPKPGTSCIKTQAINIIGLEPGEYNLNLAVSDGAAHQSVYRHRPFWIYERAAETNTLPISEQDIRKYRNQIKYFATAQELKVFDMLTPQEIESFLVTFWRSRDKTPETPENEYMLDCYRRINYAYEHFKGRDSGLDSDMGRIFVVYGQPDEIEDYSMNMDGKPYVIWHYFTGSSGKHFFVFVDTKVDGVYSLVHSDVVGEINNEYWREQDLK
jgi:GWxTD domain-containing protein